MKVAIMGSGNGGCTAAADLALLGHEVSIWDFPQFGKNIQAISEKGGIEVFGDLEGFAKVAYAGFDLEQAVKDAEVIMAVGPAYSTENFAKELKPFLKKEQHICVCPSSCGSALVFKKGLGVGMYDNDYIVGETSTLPYATRVTELGKLDVFLKLKGGLFYAALPAERGSEGFAKFKELYPHATHAKSLLMTMLQTGNNIIHPSVTLLNAGRIESTGGDFYFYEDGATPATGKLMKALDDEKMALSDKLDIGLIRDTTVKLDQAYNAVDSYETGYRTAPGFKGLPAQKTLDTRYMHEDVGYGMLFISELAKQVGIDTPNFDAMIRICSVVMDRDYRAEAALTPKTLGLDQINEEELKALFTQK